MSDYQVPQLEDDGSPQDGIDIIEENPVLTLAQRRELGLLWSKEVEGATKRLKKFMKQGAKVENRYLGHNDEQEERSRVDISRLNLFHSNIQSLEAFMYNRVPKVDVSRSFSDANDDVARVASLIIERVLNCDVSENGKEYDTVLKSALQDRLLPGLGCARVRYYYDEDTGGEYTPVDYIHWRDVLWSDGRNFSDLTWIGFRNYLTEAQVADRFGERIAKQLSFQIRNPEEVPGDGLDKMAERDDNTVNKTAEIIEIFDRDNEKVVWYSCGLKEVLDLKDDFLGVKGFFPCPPMMMANLTTTNYMPTADFKLAEDIYNNIDVLQTRIDKITATLRVVGVYDSKAGDSVGRMLNEGQENNLIPVENWESYTEKGGTRGSIEWFPVEEVAKTLNELVRQRSINIQLLQEVTGMADVMRGDLQNQYEGVGQTQQKTVLGSARIQSLQDQFAQFVSDLMQLKLDVIAKNYDDMTILQKANIQFNPADAQLVPQALQLIRSSDKYFRVKVEAESMATIDLGAIRQERLEFMGAISKMLAGMAPIIEQEPGAQPLILEMVKWVMASFKGSNEIEGVLDQAISMAQQSAQQQQNEPNEAQQAEQAKTQGQLQLESAKHQMKMQEIQAATQGKIAERQADMRSDLATMRAQLEMDLAKSAADSESDTVEIQAKTLGKLAEIEAEMNANVNQAYASADAEMAKDLQDLEGRMAEIVADARAAITVEQEKVRLNPKPEGSTGNEQD